MFAIEDIRKSMNVDNAEMDRLMIKAYIRPNIINRNGDVSIFLNNEMIERIQKVRSEEARHFITKADPWKESYNEIERELDIDKYKNTLNCKLFGNRFGVKHV